MKNITLQYYGNGFAVGINGKNQDEVNQTANRLFNWAATESEPHFMSDTFAYVLSTEEKLVHFFAVQMLLRLVGKMTKDMTTTKGLRRMLANKRWSHVNKLAQEKFNALPKDKFIPEALIQADTFQIGNSDYSAPNDDKGEAWVRSDTLEGKEEKIVTEKACE